MNDSTKKILAALVLAGFAATAAAQPAFEEVDANGDGLITADEGTAVEGFDLASLDTNGDGAVSREEWDAGAK